MKQILLLLIVLFLMCGMCSCKRETKNMEKPVEIVETETPVEEIEKYISNLPSNSDRNEFADFWNLMYTYYYGMSKKLEELEDTSNYKFDPLEEELIPEEIKTLYNFSKIKLYKGYDKHSNYQVEINGNSIRLSFDGITFFPSNYDYSDIVEIVEKYNENINIGG